ncbi:MAG: amidohydrolase family protein [Acidobacteria bacterium]|nr:amidohydrolase family protein [Acidobacteriota bacterium]
MAVVRVRATWILPVAAPKIRDGWIDVDPVGREILAVGTPEALSGRPAATVVDLPGAVILPGLVNAHTHLELSHLAGAVPPADDFVTWVRVMLGVRAGLSSSVAHVVEAVERAIASMEATGTAAVGDIVNTDVAVRPLGASTLAGIHWREALGFTRDAASRIAVEARLGAVLAQTILTEQGSGRVVASLAPHAPYSTSAPLIQTLAQGYLPVCPISSIHLAESSEEVEFLASGTGPFRALLDDLGAWDEGWTPPGLSPVAYLQQIDALHARLLAVHGTQATREDLGILAAAGASLVLCARSNRWVGSGVPPVAAAVDAGVSLAIGTDSLASVEDLNLFAELAYLRTVAPEVPAPTLIRAATLGGARALGCASLGLLAPGASSRAIVRVPPAGVRDVEEWVVAAASDTADLRWLDEIAAAVR